MNKDVKDAVLNRLEIFSKVLLLILGLLLGFLGTTLYQTLHTERVLNGLWMHNFNETGANEKAQEMDGLGDWVCININRMTIDDIILTCNHEAAHELFAEKCEGNASKCFIAIENMENMNNINSSQNNQT